MSNEIKNATVVITGGASGIGYAIANNFLENNAKTAIVLDINEKHGTDATDTLKSKYGERRAEFYKCDVAADLDVIYKQITNKHETIDVLMNCAGITESQDFRKTLEVNATALIAWSLKFHEHMRTDRSGKGGTIVNISSVLGYRVLPFAPLYQASKYAVLGFTKSLGHVYNYNKFGVRVIAICPGLTDTNIVKTTNTYFPELYNDFKMLLAETAVQKADVVGKAAVEIFRIADSGTAWEIEDSKEVFLVS